MADRVNRDDDEPVSGAVDEQVRGVSDDDDEFDDDMDADDLDDAEEEEEGTTF